MAGRRVTGLSRRFYAIIGALIVLTAAAFTVLKPDPAPVFDPMTCPLFALDDHPLAGCEQSNVNAHRGDTLAGLKPGWSAWYKRAGGVNGRVNSTDTFTGENYVPNLGKLMRLKVYLPPIDQAQSMRPDLSRRTRGWTFVPATLIRGDQVHDLAALGADAAKAITGDDGSVKPLMLGFRDSDLPAPGAEGAAFEVTAMLYWRSDRLNPSPDAAGLNVATVFLVDKASPISTVELAAPTSHRADLNLLYQENDEELVVHDVEWSTVSRQMRVCVSVTNMGLDRRNPWAGFNGMQATIAGRAAETGAPDPTAGFASAQEMLQGTPLRGYVTFSETVAPDQDLDLIMPRLGDDVSSSSNDQIRITVPRSRIHPVGTQDDTQTSPCAGGARASEDS